jgi:hypothetical protein
VNSSNTLLPAVAGPTAAGGDPLSSDHCADALLGLLHRHGWSLVSTPGANVHATSPCGRIYVGWLPEDPSAWRRGIVWRITVRPVNSTTWTQEFGLHTPAEAVAAFLTALIAALPCATTQR